MHMLVELCRVPFVYPLTLWRIEGPHRPPEPRVYFRVGCRIRSHKARNFAHHKNREVIQRLNGMEILEKRAERALGQWGGLNNAICHKA